MECQFIVGQKVVCINDETNPRWIPRGESLPEKGNVYTIRHIGLDPWESCPLVWLKEIVNPVLRYHRNGVGAPPHETGFWAKYFKPLEETQTDISIFTKMLDPNNKFVEIRKTEYAFNNYVIGAYRLGSVDAALRRIKERIARMDGS